MVVPVDSFADDAPKEAERHGQEERYGESQDESARGESDALLFVHVMVDVSTFVEDHLGVRAQLTLGRQRNVYLGRVGQPRKPERERRLFRKNRPAVASAPHRSNG